MPNPCEPFAFAHCHGPYYVGIRITLPPGYEDRLVPDGPLVRHSEVEHTLNTAFDRHPTRMRIRRQGGAESAVACGSERVYRPDPGDGSMPPIDRWLVETYLHANVWPVGYRNRGAELAQTWVGTLTTIPLPGGDGDITVEVISLHTTHDAIVVTA